MDVFLKNLTSLCAEAFVPASAPSPLASILAKGVFQLRRDGTLAPGDEPASLTGADMHTGEPGKSAVRYESDFVPFKPRADVLCVGQAFAPGGIPTTECLVAFSAGPVNKTIRVVGNRRWIPVLRPLFVLRSRPEPFVSMPVSFDYAYGGKNAGKPGGFRFFPFNAVGKGYSRWGWGLKNLALPNLEDPKKPVRFWWQRPQPVSFGPVGRTWKPRLQKAGTYNKRWLKERAPALPEDFDEGYYNCAPEDQQIDGYLRGDEEVRVQNMHSEFPDLRFRLPGTRIRALIDRESAGLPRLEDVPMNLDTLWIDMDALVCVLVWRGRVEITGRDRATSVLVVDEPLAAPAPAPESYRRRLNEVRAEENSALHEAEEGERELDVATGSVSAPMSQAH